MKDDTLKERRSDILHKLKAYFREERDEDLGDLAAYLLRLDPKQPGKRPSR